MPEPYFNYARTAAAYLANKPLFYAALRPIEAALLAEHLPLLAAPRLDFGCGDGFFSAQLTPRHYFDFSFDIDASLASKATQAYCHFLTPRDGRIPLPDASLGSILTNSVLEHIPDPSSALREWHRVLRPGGRVLGTLTLRNWDLAQPALFRRGIRRLQRHHTLLDAAAWQALFEAHGLSCEWMRGYITPREARTIVALHVPALFNELLRRLCLPPNCFRFHRPCATPDAPPNLSFDQACCTCFLLRKSDDSTIPLNPASP